MRSPEASSTAFTRAGLIENIDDCPSFNLGEHTAAHPQRQGLETALFIAEYAIVAGIDDRLKSHAEVKAEGLAFADMTCRGLGMSIMYGS